VNGVSSPPARCVLSIAFVAVLSHPVWAVAQDEVTYVARDFTFTGPDAIAAGMVPVRLRNEGRDLHQIQFIKLSTGKTAADFTAQINADPSRMPSWVQRKGGPNSVAPGEQALAFIGLEPGDYVLICGIPDSQGMPHLARGMLKSVKVLAGGARSNSHPATDLTITAVDFRFELSGPITAGSHIVRVVNNGSQPHEVVVVRLAPGASADDFLNAFRPGVAVSPAGHPVGGLVGIDPGRDGFFRMNFAAGNYGLICFLPDIARGAPHFTRGMMMDISVR